MLRCLALVLAVVSVAGCSSEKKKSDPPTDPTKPTEPAVAAVTSIRIAGASDLTKAFQDLGAKWQAQTKITPMFEFGSSGLLARQIKEGAPIDLYAAANVAFVDDVIAAGKCDPTTKTMYGRGRIVIWTKEGKVTPPSKLEDLVDKRFGTIAIASPDHAPYGKAAKQAMEKAGVWPTVEGRIKYAENISQTLQWAQTGNVDVAIVALSLSIVTKGGTAVEVPADLHDPIDQALVVCATGAKAEAAKQFAAYVASPEGRALMKDYGFVVPTP